MIALQKILLATDFSDCSKRATSYACAIARRSAARIHVLHVLEPLIIAPALGEALPPTFFAERERSAEEQLQEWSSAIEDYGLETTGSVVHGNPFVEIVRYAREHGIDLIVMGTHGRSAIAHAVIGSVAEKVVRKAQCPVLTVRPEGHQFEMP